MFPGQDRYYHIHSTEIRESGTHKYEGNASRHLDTLPCGYQIERGVLKLRSVLTGFAAAFRVVDRDTIVPEH